MKTVWVVQKEESDIPRYIIGIFDTYKEAIAKVKALKSRYTSNSNDWRTYDFPFPARRSQYEDVIITIDQHECQ